jgi:uncharacterized protein
MMRVVIDTNVLLSSLPKASDSGLVFLALIRGVYSICVTTDILEEYEEVFQQRANPEIAARAFDVLDVIPNLIRVNKYYFWRLITVDPDDNKFVDCAIASGADFIVTDDRHFNVLKNIPFPKVRVVSKKEFLEMLKT